MNPWVLRAGLLVGGVLSAQVGQAATLSGTIDASLNLTGACQVNGVSGTSGLNFGKLNFGNQNALFASASGQVFAISGAAMTIHCSAGAVPVIKVSGGSNDGRSTGAARALADGAGNFVPYDLYADPGHTQLLAIDGTVTLAASTGVEQTVNLYGKAVGKAGLAAGTYTDTIAVELSF